MSPNQLKARYRYQFRDSERNDYSFARGWFPGFVMLCEQIDRILGPDKRGFHWRQIKEKFGSARYYWATDDFTPFTVDIIGVATLTTQPPEETLDEKLADAISAAQEETQTRCIACGERGEHHQFGGWVLVLCPAHRGQRERDYEGLLQWTYLGDDDDMPL